MVSLTADCWLKTQVWPRLDKPGYQGYHRRYLPFGRRSIHPSKPDPLPCRPAMGACRCA